MTSLKHLKTGILLFWALWFLVAATTNLFDLLNQYTLLPENWKLLSHNYNLVKNIMSIYATSDYIVMLTFTLIVLAEFIISYSFWLALFHFRKPKSVKQQWVTIAFTLSIFLWAAFLVGEEIFIAYAFEGTHISLLIAELTCLIAIGLLP